MEMETAAEMIGVTPDMHFWHHVNYQGRHDNWSKTGDPDHLSKMLLCIKYQSAMPDGGGWYEYDNWESHAVKDARREKYHAQRMAEIKRRQIRRAKITITVLMIMAIVLPLVFAKFCCS